MREPKGCRKMGRNCGTCLQKVAGNLKVGLWAKAEILFVIVENEDKLLPF